MVFRGVVCVFAVVCLSSLQRASVLCVLIAVVTLVLSASTCCDVCFLLSLFRLYLLLPVVCGGVAVAWCALISSGEGCSKALVFTLA